MSALNNLAEFVYKLPEELQPEFMKLVDAVTDERDRLQNERIATSQATTGTFEVVAIAGTAETLLNEINVGDTVELNPNVAIFEADKLYLGKSKATALNIVTELDEDKEYLKINNSTYWLRAELFRKASTPSINPLNSVEGC